MACTQKADINWISEDLFCYWGSLLILPLSSWTPLLSITEVYLGWEANSSYCFYHRGKLFLHSFLTHISWNITGSRNQLSFPSYIIRILSFLKKDYQVPPDTLPSMLAKLAPVIKEIKFLSWGVGWYHTLFFSGQSRWVAISKVISESVQVFKLEWEKGDQPLVLPGTEGKGLYINMSKQIMFQIMKQQDKNVLPIYAGKKKFLLFMFSVVVVIILILGGSLSWHGEPSIRFAILDLQR